MAFDVPERAREHGRWIELTRAELEEAAAAYARLHSVRAVARELGLSFYGAWYRLWRAGVILDDPNGLSEDDHEAIRYLYCELKLSVREIAAELGLTVGAVMYRLKQAGIKTRPPTPDLTDQELLETEAVYLEERSRAKAGRRLGLSKSTVHRHLELLAARRAVGKIPPAAAA